MPQTAPRGVKEFRIGFPGGPIRNHEALEPVELARHAHRAWTSGRTVRIHCQARVNRSGVVSVHVLRLLGYLPHDATALLRDRRSQVVLSNGH